MIRVIERSVVQVGDPVLRRRAAEVPVDRITSDPVARLIDAMWETLDAVPGVGLAAPQIGEPWRVVVVHDLPEYLEGLSEVQLAERERRVIEPYVLINPVLTTVGSETRTHFEGCLSVEGYTAAVERFHEVDVEFTDPGGRVRRQRVDGCARAHPPTRARPSRRAALRGPHGHPDPVLRRVLPGTRRTADAGRHRPAGRLADR